jgi:hypothetical protein
MGNVQEIEQSRTTKRKADDAWERRQAMVLAAQLPEDHQMALRVIEHMRTLVTTYLSRSTPAA